MAKMQRTEDNKESSLKPLKPWFLGGALKLTVEREREQRVKGMRTLLEFHNLDEEGTFQKPKNRPIDKIDS